MRPERAPEQVIAVSDVRHPIAQSFVDGVFQSARAVINFTNFGAQKLHAKNVQRLTPHVFGAHINNAFQTKERANSCSRHAVLARARLRDDAAFAHAARQKNLTERVVDLVRARVKQIFALEINARAAGKLSQASREEKRSRPPGVVAQQRVKLALKTLIRAR